MISVSPRWRRTGGNYSEGQGWGWIGWSVWHHSWDHPKAITLPLSRGTCPTDKHRAPKLRLLLQTLPWGVGGCQPLGPEPLGREWKKQRGKGGKVAAAVRRHCHKGAAVRKAPQWADRASRFPAGEIEQACFLTNKDNRYGHLTGYLRLSVGWCPHRRESSLPSAWAT